MIKNIIFDIGNVILNFRTVNVIKEFTSDKEKQNFIYNNIINSPEWLKNSLIDTGYLTKEEAIEIVKDRTNHIDDELIEKFWNNYNDYSEVNNNVLDLIKKLKDNYRIYLLSNINPYTHEKVKKSNLFELVDGYILSYEVHKIKPYEGIYYELKNNYNLEFEECLFIDDNVNNIQTATKLGIKPGKVNPDDYDSIVEILKKYNIKGI